MGCRLLTVAVVLFCWALPLQAQESVELEFSAGRVNLTAQNASARTILAEWARLGGATIVNGDNMVSPPLTLELVGVPEQQALDIILRDAAGYNARAATRRSEERIGIRPYSDPGHQRRTQESAAAGGRAGCPRPTLRRPPVIGRQPQTGLGAPIGGGAGSGVTVFDPLGDQGGEEFDPQQSGNPGLIPQPFVRRPPDQSGSEPSDPRNYDR
jgi:hypothetical protein